MLVTELFIPNIGESKDVPVIEIPIAIGDQIKEGDTIVVIESDKAMLDVPASSNGTISEIFLSEGDPVSEGSLIAKIVTSNKLSEPEQIAQDTNNSLKPTTSHEKSLPKKALLVTPLPHQPASKEPIYASPSLRKLARELGVNLSQVKGTGPRSRIIRDDIVGFIKQIMLSPDAPTTSIDLGVQLPAWPEVDYAKYGSVSRVKLSRVARISGPSLTRNSILIPHVTNFEKADITALEAFRIHSNSEKDAIKMSLLAFIVKATAVSLKLHPQFNTSLDGDELVFKDYYNIGVAMDTLGGLLVPVVKSADSKSVRMIAAEMIEFATLAREGKLQPTDMHGGTFTISSLGGIGGENFTPIINAPEVAILGLVRSTIQPVWDGDQFQPRLIQPISLSWDHRVVDGVAAARFLKTVQSMLEDFRRINL